jgi:DNA-binding MarR family transcriptional regulator
MQRSTPSKAPRAASQGSRDGNVLGALSLVLADRMSDAVSAAAGGQSQTAAAALCALAQFLDGCTLDRLCRVLGMTSSGTVRLVDRLEAAGLVRRGHGDDARSTSLTLTAAGTRTARRVTAARGAVLEGALDMLSVEDRRTFERLVAEVLSRVASDKARRADGTAWICRLCDLPACGRDAGTCPAANAARDALRSGAEA